MNASNQPNGGDFETRLDALLASRPVTPASDFVVRTMARIRSETALTASARAGDEAAIDELLDRWLGEQPLEPEFEPAQLAIHARREATREEIEENQPVEAPWRRLISFPTWSRAAGTLAAAAALALVAYVGTHEKSSQGTRNLAAQQGDESTVAATDDTQLPSQFDVAYVSGSLPKLDDSLKEAIALADSPDADSLTLLADAVQQNDGMLDGPDAALSTGETPQ